MGDQPCPQALFCISVKAELWIGCFRGPLLALIVKDSSEMRRMQKEIETTEELASFPTGVAQRE